MGLDFIKYNYPYYRPRNVGFSEDSFDVEILFLRSNSNKVKFIYSLFNLLYLKVITLSYDTDFYF